MDLDRSELEAIAEALEIAIDRGLWHSREERHTLLSKIYQELAELDQRWSIMADTDETEDNT